MPGLDTTVVEAGRSLREAARVHKRSASAHRRQARDLMQKLARLEKECAEYGIKLELDIDQGGHSGAGKKGS